MSFENEFRVRAVRRYVVTHYNTKCKQMGEFPNIEQAEVVGRALAASMPGATFQTIADKREPVGVFYAYTHQECDALAGALHGISAQEH